MEKHKKILSYFSKSELILWFGSIGVIVVTFFAFEQNNHLTLIASLIGVTSLIFNAKGNPFGQILMVIFSLLYGIISFTFSYYGEMITYLGMTMPMAVFALISWWNNPFNEHKSEVRISRLSRNNWSFMWVTAALITFCFYFILAYFNTANIIPSTISITTSYIAAYLTFKRSPYYAIGYAVNDIILIILWILAAFEDVSYLSVVICFTIFLVNDIYGFINWRRIEKRQEKTALKLI